MVVVKRDSKSSSPVSRSPLSLRESWPVGSSSSSSFDTQTERRTFPNG